MQQAHVQALQLHAETQRKLREYVRECEAELDRRRQALREAELKQSRLEDAVNRKKRRLQAALAREEMSGM